MRTPDPPPLAWSATIGSMADQVRMEGRVHFGSLSVGIGSLSRVADASRVLHVEGITAGLGAEFGALELGVDWVDYGAHTITRLEGGLMAADTFYIPPHPVVVRADYPTQGFLLSARFQRAPFALDVRTLTASGAGRGSLLPVQAIAEWTRGRAALLAGYGRPSYYGQLGFEPHPFAGLSWSLGPGVRTSAASEGSDASPAVPAFHAFCSGDVIHLEVEAPRARSVEVASDVNAWEPVALMRAGDGHWAGSIAAGPGTLRILMRIDGGAWQPPPGLPVAHEPTTGDVGIIAP
jgi:hypothetical protein